MQSVAIIGTGISGLGSAYMLQEKYDVTIYEKNDYIGGHTRTVDIKTKEGTVPVDTGFIVFNHNTYPNLTALFNQLGVNTNESLMSFGVSVNNGWLEYGSQTLANVFAQKKNLLSLKYLKFIKDIFTFNNYSQQLIASNTINPTMTLSEYLQQLKVGKWFIDYYILAMGAAIWSSPVEKMHAFPAESFIRFFNNHGLLATSGQPQWHTVDGGSKAYIDKILDNLNANIKLNSAVSKVERVQGKVKITDNNGDITTYDHVVFASHSDQTLSMLSDTTESESDILNKIKYQKNRMVLHSDESFMPKNKKAWSSWIYLSENKKDEGETIALSYWMNNLQKLDTKQSMIVTLNPSREPSLSLKHDEYIFDHPVFDGEAIEAQKRLPEIQGEQNTWFAGAYWSYGFHEDGLNSAINVAKGLGVNPSWLPQ
jgi:predicted NAD/FAD-binding protein